MNHPAIKGHADFWKPPYQNMLVGGIPTPLKKKESQLGALFPTEWKKHVPNHQPVIIYVILTI